MRVIHNLRDELDQLIAEARDGGGFSEEDILATLEDVVRTVKEEGGHDPSND